MSEFYSVLRQTLIDRNLRSAEQREEAYSQARTAMIRRLWAFDPPLAEDEIDARIGQFDIAVDRIESDLVATFAEVDAAEAAVRQRALPPPRPPAPARTAPLTVVDGYDVEADYAPAFGGQPLPARTADDDAYYDDGGDDPWAEVTSGAGAAHITVEDRSLTIEAALRVEPADDGAEEADEIVPEPPPSRHRPDARPAADHGYEPAPRDAYDDEVADAPPPDRYGQRARGGARSFDHRMEVPAFDDRTEDEPAYRPRRARARPPAADQGKVRLLLIAVAALMVVFIATSAYVFIPLIFDSGTGDRPGGPAGAALPANVGDPATAARIPTEAANVAQTITLFDGRDPTVFEADSNNPIRFTGTEANGFASVSTSTSSAGARVVIGPGLSSRLAGQNIRVNIIARSTREDGTPSLRFAYQSGLAISHWQTASLSPEFAPYGLVWRVPTLRTNPSGDYIIIEPGIPGDGTSADIRSVTIDVLAQ